MVIRHASVKRVYAVEKSYFFVRTPTISSGTLEQVKQRKIDDMIYAHDRSMCANAYDFMTHQSSSCAGSANFVVKCLSEG